MRKINRNSDGSIAVQVDLGVYDKDAIIETTYLFTDKYYVNTETAAGNKAIIRLSPKDQAVRAKDLAEEFMNELVDQQLRLRLRGETAEIRRMIISEAFAPLELPDEDA